MSDESSSKPSAVATNDGAVLDRRHFVAGLAGAGVAAAVWPSVAQAALGGVAPGDIAPSGPAGLISIAGRITNSLGAPEKRAYVEVMQHRVREWTPGATPGAIDVQTWDGPEWLGVWTDDDGVFGVHTWWAVDGREAHDLARSPRQAEVRFQVETQDGRRLLRTLWLNANPRYAAWAAEEPSMLTPVAWDRREETAQFIANFSVG